LKPASDAASRQSRSTGGIAGHGCRIRVDAVIAITAASVTQPALPQLVIATDIWWPPGVNRCRNGACLTIARRPEASSLRTAGKSAQQHGALRHRFARRAHIRNALEQIRSQSVRTHLAS
jgi:hypothetical protein